MTVFGINILDLIFVGVVAFFAIRGAMHGLLEEGATLAGLFLGFVLANLILDDVIAFFSSYVSSSMGSVIIAYLVIFVLAIVLAIIVSRLLRQVLVVSVSKWFDHISGAVFGAANGIVGCLLVYMGFQFISPHSEVLYGSTLVPYLSDLFVTITEVLPNLIPDSNPLGLPSSLIENSDI